MFRVSSFLCSSLGSCHCSLLLLAFTSLVLRALRHAAWRNTMEQCVALPLRVLCVSNVVLRTAIVPAAGLLISYSRCVTS